ncbi:MAG: hydroxymethylbilane synthase [Tatlockia sp.]|jgi:hydroxymethylbilane synthase
MTTIRIATRKSPLALWQASHIGEQIKQHWPQIQIELVPMLTSGDQFLKDKLAAEGGGKGLFVKELEEALLANKADLAVHSMKDVPAFFPEGLSLAAICKRHTPFDALVALNQTKWQDLPKGAVIGTTSLRRQSQLLALRPDVIIKGLRGNIHTRLKKLQAGEFDAIILAAAGLKRMGLEAFISDILNEDRMLPACGQGALGIECRTEDSRIQALIAPLNHQETALCVQTERQVSALLGGNCHVPLAVYCKIDADNRLDLRAKVLSLDGKTVLCDSQSGVQAERDLLARRCAQSLLGKGAEKLLSLSS